MAEQVNHPSHYGGANNPYEAIKVIEAWGLGFCPGNSVKYISRAGKKSPETCLEDLKKARWYLNREIGEEKKVPEISATEALALIGRTIHEQRLIQQDFINKICEVLTKYYKSSNTQQAELILDALFGEGCDRQE